MLRGLVLIVTAVALYVAGNGFLIWWAWQARAFGEAGEWVAFAAMFALLVPVGYVCAGKDGRAEIRVDWERVKADPWHLWTMFRGPDQR